MPPWRWNSIPLKPYIIAVSWIPVVFTFTETVSFLSFVGGKSMSPSLNPVESKYSDILLLSRDKSNIKVGDVVLFRSPKEPEKILVKRVLGVDGDVVVPRLSTYPKKFCNIPPNHLWVEGDNIHSVDSNNFGPISSGLVLGKAKLVVFPFSRFGAITHGGREARLREIADDVPVGII